MPLPTIIFDVGAIGSLGTRRVTTHETTTRDGAQFVQARRVNPPKRQWRLSWGGTPLVTFDAAMDLWTRTFGGATAMTFVPPDDGVAYAVRFAGQPSLTSARLGHKSVTFSVDLVEV